MRRIPVATVDALWDQGGTVAATLWDKGGVFNGDVGYYLAAVIVYLLMGAVCVYTLFLMALARVALAVLLAIGPLFIVLLLFDGTQAVLRGVGGAARELRTGRSAGGAGGVAAA